MTRVPTNFQFQQSLGNLQNVQQRLDLTTYQISSGLRAQQFSDIATEANELLNLQDLRSINNQYITNIDTVDSRLNATENAVQGLSDLLIEAANVWTLGRNENTAETRATLAPNAEALTQAFYNIFNTKFDGRYLFSGAAANQPPITSAPTANTFPGSIPAPNTYYNGDTQRMQVISGNNSVEEYGITGDHNAFANIKAGLEALWFGLENNSETDIDGAIDLLTTSQDEISSLLGEIGGQQASFDLVRQRHENANIFLDERVDAIEKVDITEAMTRFNQEIATMEASMAVITRMNSLSLVDFL